MQVPALPQSPKRPARVRMHPRAKVSGQALIHDEERLFIAPLTDLSAGGIFVGRLVHLPVGRSVKVVVKGSRLAAPVQVLGTVVRVETEGRQGMAIAFSELSEVAKNAIQACVFELRMEAALKAA